MLRRRRLRYGRIELELDLEGKRSFVFFNISFFFFFFRCSLVQCLPADIPLSEPEFPYQRVSSPRLLFYLLPAFGPLSSTHDPIILRSRRFIDSPNFVEYFAKERKRRRKWFRIQRYGDARRWESGINWKQRETDFIRETDGGNRVEQPVKRWMHLATRPIVGWKKVTVFRKWGHASRGSVGIGNGAEVEADDLR